MPRVDNKGISIHYRVEGNGPPLVLGHGITDSSDVFYERGYVAALKANYRLVLIDARGHGQSDKPHEPLSYASEKVSSDIVSVLDDSVSRQPLTGGIHWEDGMGLPWHDTRWIELHVSLSEVRRPVPHRRIQPRLERKVPC